MKVRLRARKAVALLATLIVALVAALAATPADAHPLAPSLLEIRTRDQGRFDVLWKTPLQSVGPRRPEPVLPSCCRDTQAPRRVDDGSAIALAWTMDCNASVRPVGSTEITDPTGSGSAAERADSADSADPVDPADSADPVDAARPEAAGCSADLVGAEIEVAGLVAGDGGALLRFVYADGSAFRAVLAAGRAAVRVPARQGVVSVVVDYAELGVRHIALGLDHLLFVFGLMALAADRRSLLTTVTAFTVGHSLTLAAAVLGYARLPQGPVELAIAASVFWVAVELGDRHFGWEPRRRMAGRRLPPWTMAGAFGLLHGLGFAAALVGAGVPESDIALALASFNVGIELGQLVFIGLVAAAARLLAGLLARRWSERLHAAAVVAMGLVSAWWLVDRSLVLF